MDRDHLVAHYEKSDERGRLLRRSQSIEFITTVRVLGEVLAPGSAILDLGAGPGRYALHFAEQGHHVTAVDPVPKHIDQLVTEARQRGCSERVRACIGDHATIGQWAAESYDAVLCMGPIYHLTSAEDRSTCVANCARVLKRGGVAAFAYINKFFALPFQVMQDRRFLNPDHIRTLIDEGSITSDDPYCGWTDCHYCSPREAEAMVSQPGLQTQMHVATDGIAILLRDMVDVLNDDEFATWVEYHFETCREPWLLGYSNHGLLVCRKRVETREQSFAADGEEGAARS